MPWMVAKATGTGKDASRSRELCRPYQILGLPLLLGSGQATLGALEQPLIGYVGGLQVDDGAAASETSPSAPISSPKQSVSEDDMR